MKALVLALAVAGAVIGCRSGQPAPPAASLIGTAWRADEIGGRGVLPGVDSTLSFDTTERMSGHTACNRYVGTFRVGERTIRFEPAGTTRMACPPDVMDQERRFLAMLAAATAFRREDGRLVLLDETGRVLVRLAPRDSPRAEERPLLAYGFDCPDGRDVVLVHVADGAIDLIATGRRHRLPKVRTASGTRYAADGISVWTKGREAMLDLDGRVSTCVENRCRSILEDARARGAEFRATGNEPGWVWELLGDRMVFVGAYGAARVTMPRPPRVAGPVTGEETYSAVADGHRLTVRIVARPCVDSMSGERHASRVEIDLDGRALRGCGDPLR
jgi:heat shock protein HslJ/uncharacterized membrane protein